MQSHSRGQAVTEAPVAFKPALNSVALGFLNLELEDYDGCLRYMKLHAEIKGVGPRPFLVEAANALRAGREPYAKKCVWKAVLIQKCADLSAKQMRAFFDGLEEDKKNSEEFKLDFTEAWGKLSTQVEKLGVTEFSRAGAATTARPHGLSQAHLPTSTMLAPHYAALQQGILLNTQTPSYQAMDGYQERQVNFPEKHSTVLADAEIDSYFDMFTRLLTGKRIAAIEDAKDSSTEISPSRAPRYLHPTLRRYPTFGTQWIDIYAPRARANWPIEGWPYIPTLAFLDSGSRSNVNSVSKDFLEQKLNMEYRPTDVIIRGHENSFRPLGVVKIEFHPVDINSRGVCEADLPLTLSFYVHDENDLFGQILLGREYMRTRADKIGLPTYKEILKLSPGTYVLGIFQ